LERDLERDWRGRIEVGGRLERGWREVAERLERGWREVGERLEALSDLLSLLVQSLLGYHQEVVSEIRARQFCSRGFGRSLNRLE